MTLLEVKNVLEISECKQYLYSAMYCSEPIMTKDNIGKTIDNYFVFVRSKDFSQITVPSVSFGIYSAEKKVAYIDEKVERKFEKNSYEELFANLEDMKKAKHIYIDLYPVIREMFEGTIPRDEGKISDYIKNLEIISGKALFGFYQKLFPSFFEWAK